MDAQGKVGLPAMSSDMPDADSLNVNIRDEGGFLLVSLCGSAGTEEGDELEQRLHELSSSSARLVLDLSELTFVNSAGLGAIVAAHRRCREQSGMLCVVNPRPAVAQVLRITHLDRLIAIHADIESARHALAAHRPPEC